MRSSRSFSNVIALAAVCACGAPAAAAGAAPSMNDALARIAQYAPQALQEQGAPGMVIAITDASHTLRIIPVGYSDAQTQSPITPNTRFGIGSLSKSMTATALLELRDTGRFDPQRPVAAYLPWFSIHTRWRPITSHDLFTHTSGLPDGGLSTGFSAVYALRNWMTGFAPGTHWSYSNAGYDTLGAILETLDRANYPRIMERRVFAPIGMADTTAQWNPQTLQSAAQGYLYSVDDALVPQDPVLMPAPRTHFTDPAGSVLSTGPDMAAYMRFLLNAGRTASGQLILPSSYALLSTPGMTDGRELGDEQPGMYHRYGYGLAIMNVDGDKVLAHTGGVISYTACMMVDVTHGFGVIALSNLGYVGPRPCPIVWYALDVLRAQVQGRPLPPVPPQRDTVHVMDAQDYAGTYTSPEGHTFKVTAKRELLTLEDAGASLPMYPRGDGLFWVDDPQLRRFGVQFERDSGGQVVAAASGPAWFTNARYRGPRAFTYPRAWKAYAGTYEAIDPNGYYWPLHVYEREGNLIADGEKLVPLNGRLFHIGTKDWTPTWLRFEEPLEGKTQVAEMPGMTLYRINPF